MTAFHWTDLVILLVVAVTAIEWTAGRVWRRL